MRFSVAAAALVPVMSASAANILVQVGAGGKLAFSPSNITAQVGDVIAFQFQGKNHSVTQSTFATPCAVQTTPAQGISSDFQFVAPNATQLPEWSFTVNNASTPLWFFCAQTNPANHCNAGMVFSVNANESSPKSFAAFQAAAMAGGGAPAAGGAGGIASAAASDAGVATSAIGAGIGDVTSAAGAAAGAAETGVANALSGAAAAATGLANALTGGGASPTGGANSTSPSAAGRTSTSAMSLVAVLGLTAGLLL